MLTHHRIAHRAITLFSQIALAHTERQLPVCRPVVLNIFATQHQVHTTPGKSTYVVRSHTLALPQTVCAVCVCVMRAAACVNVVAPRVTRRSSSSSSTSRPSREKCKCQSASANTCCKISHEFLWVLAAVRRASNCNELQTTKQPSVC